MSNFVLEDGRSGRTAEVNTDNQLEVFSTRRTQLSQALLEGNAFIVTTPAVNLTSAITSGILYISNTDTMNWVINRWFVNVGTSAGGSGDHTFQLIYNVTGGTLVSGGTSFDAKNVNAGSANTLTGSFIYGAEGSTTTNGDVIVDSIVPATAARTAIAEDNFVVPPGTNAVVTVTPPTGNTSQNVQVGFLLHRV